MASKRSRPRSGPGRRRGPAQKDPPPVPLCSPRLCGWRLQRRQARRRSGGSTGYSGDRQAHGQGRRVQAHPAALVVERTFSWIRRNRRLMAHYEAIAIIAEGFAKLAMISVMLKRLTEPSQSLQHELLSQALSGMLNCQECPRTGPSVSEGSPGAPGTPLLGFTPILIS